MSDSRMKVTGERLVPGDVKSAVDYLHLLRHQVAYEYVKGQLAPSDKLLEVGFGEGYGSEMLLGSCDSYTGVDVAEDAVDYAGETYGAANCKFDHYDGGVLPYDDESFDVVISFQVIEHVPEDVGFVRQLARVLKKGGRLYLTTPNKATRLKPGQKPWNRFHLREYYDHELSGVLSEFFEDVRVDGVFGSDKIHEIEMNRIKQGGLLSILLKLGLRNLLPERTDAIIARFVGKLRGSKHNQEAPEDFMEKYSVNDYRVEDANVDQSLDLMGVAVK